MKNTDKITEFVNKAWMKDDINNLTPQQVDQILVGIEDFIDALKPTNEPIVENFEPDFDWMAEVASGR